MKLEVNEHLIGPRGVYLSAGSFSVDPYVFFFPALLLSFNQSDLVPPQSI